MTRAKSTFSPNGLRAALLGLGLALLSACTNSGGLTPPADIPGGDVAAPADDVGSPLQTPTISAGRTGGEPLASPSANQVLAAPVATAPTRQAAISRSGPIQFLPVVGAPPKTVELLSEALVASAVRNGVAIMPSDGAVAPLRLKGYLSALAEGSGTLVVYVWDIVDPAGNRVSRIQGQQVVDGTAADPWSVVGKDALAAIAQKTIDEFQHASSSSG